MLYFCLLKIDSRNYLTEEEINEIINSSGSDIDSSNSDSEISDNVYVDGTDVYKRQAYAKAQHLMEAFTGQHIFGNFKSLDMQIIGRRMRKQIHSL